MKNRSIIFLIPLLIAMSACQNSFLDTADPRTLNSDNFPSTMEHLDLMLNGIYANQHSFGLFGHNMLSKNSYCFDHTQDQGWTAFQFWNDLNQNNAQPNNEFMNETWRDAWKGVQRSNALISGLATYREKFASANDEPELKLIEGQAYYIRAWHYFYLISFWGEDFIINGQGGEKLGVPLITEVASELDQTQLPRASVRQIWDLIIADLKRSETLLEGVTWSGNDRNRVDMWAVKSFLGKAYAFSDDWANAEITLKSVIDGSGKSLAPFDVYNAMFNGKNEFNSESIYELNLNVDRNTWGAWGDQSTGSSIGMVISPCFMNNSGGADASGWSNVFPHDKTLERFGFKEPVVNLIPNPAFDSNSPASIDNQPEIPDPAYVARSRDLRATQQVDPRLYVGTLQPYLDSMTVDGRVRPIVPFKDVPTTFQAWSFRKYVNLEGNEYSVNVNNGSNVYWLRLADVYLLYAEALIRNGKSGEGLEYINKIKRRAYGLPSDVAAPGIDYTSLTDQTNATDPVLQNDPLKYERWAELYGEGHWWFDVRRWKIGAQEATYYQSVRGGPIQFTDTDYAQPIPQSEIEANSSMVQNPGYN